MKRLILLAVTATLLLAACNRKATTSLENMNDEQLKERAEELAHRYIITDGHVDLPYRLKVRNFRLTREFIGIPVKTSEGDFDFVRAKEGGLDAPFMSIYIPASHQETGTAMVFADSLIDMVNGIIQAHPDKFAAAGSPDQVEQNFKKGLLSLPMGMENGAPVMDDLANVRYFFDRNMSDEMIERLGENGGVIQINFGSSFLDGEIQKYRNEKRDELRALLEEKGLDWRDEAAEPVIEQFEKDNPSLYADVQKVADHIDHVVKLAGIDHVGLGSDFDGVGDSLPTGLKDVSQYPNLIQELLRRGYSEEDIAKICYKNVFRVWRQVTQKAEELQARS